VSEHTFKPFWAGLFVVVCAALLVSFERTGYDHVVLVGGLVLAPFLVLLAADHHVANVQRRPRWSLALRVFGSICALFLGALLVAAGTDPLGNALALAVAGVLLLPSLALSAVAIGRG
jgi:hypothetical protein